MATQQIDPDEVSAVFLACLFQPDELINGDWPDDAMRAEGIMLNCGFHRQRLESHRQQIRDWLLLLPMEFRKTGGGGWTFLNACNQADGTQWTGMHHRMDQLFTLGIALHLARWQMPRDFWDALPGGMPYVEIEA